MPWYSIQRNVMPYPARNVCRYGGRMHHNPSFSTIPKPAIKITQRSNNRARLPRLRCLPTAAPPNNPLCPNLLLHSPFQRREVKSLTPAACQCLPPPPPQPWIRPLCPRQGPDPRLHIPAYLQRHVPPLGQMSRWIGDLVLWFLVPEVDDPWLA